jgi:hypothetical protein
MKEQLSGKQSDVNRERAGAPPVPDELLPEAGTVITPHEVDTAREPLAPSAMPAVDITEEPPVKKGTAETEDIPMDDEPATTAPTVVTVHRHKFLRRLSWILPLTIVLFAALAMAIPTSRYTILAYVLKRQFAVTIMDSKTNTPVTGASVSLDGVTRNTDNAGRATFNARVGKRTVSVAMKYYQSASFGVFVGIQSDHNSYLAKLNATGRQVPVVVTNKITGKPIANATIKVSDIQAKTDASGKVTIVLPTSGSTQPATFTADGYNESSAQIQVTDQVVAVNTFSLVPAGRVYFLSNLSGHVDVVSTNLDGTNRSTVLAGTGSEDTTYTALLATRDWKYLALLSRRDGGSHAKLFLVNPINGKATVMDSDIADYTPVGWSGHTFVYEAAMYANNPWQSGGTVLRSYNAETGKVITIDQTTALGTQSSYIYSYFGYAQIVGNRVVYGFGWTDFNSNYAPNNLGGQNIAMMSANVDGTNKVDLRDVSIPNGTTYAYATALLQSPQVVAIQTAIGSQAPVFYTYQYQNNTITQSNTITSASFTAAQQSHTAYLLSPSGNAAFWSVIRDGKNTLFVGDANSLNGTQIATQSDYSVYGWYTDNYLLVQKGNNELYVMPTSGGTPMKVSDYFHPGGLYASGYSGSYGSL